MVLSLWTEKYRPKRLDEVINQKHVVERLKAWVKEGSIPHMLFAGSAGVGKSSLALVVAMELFGEHWRQNFLELNASDERGIQVVRENIKNFARMKTIGSETKIIFLDEADALTPEAQQALRRTMEKFSSVTRFILSCNYSSRLIDPIQSRTAVFRFKRLAGDDVHAFLKRIVEGEKIKASEDGLKAIYDVSEGDLRKAANLLQASAALGEVTKETVYEVASRATPKDIKEMLSLALGGNFAEARKKLYDLLINQGLAGEDIIKGIHREIFELDIPEERKVELLERTGEAEFRLNQGGSEEIQIEALLAGFLKAK
ncbi:MAG: replication factor C small subunit [Candidatus Aenigmarchaeota archaeon]|nr:replication factor C small subunit [Candidatus Aenigmarchaeota archaeon]